MGCVVPAELSLDLRPTFVPKTIANFLFHLSTIQTTSDKLSKLHDFLSRLEDELNKIDAFKRELPLSMLLLNDGSYSFPISSSFFSIFYDTLFNFLSGFLIKLTTFVVFDSMGLMGLFCFFFCSNFGFEGGIGKMYK